MNRDLDQERVLFCTLRQHDTQGPPMLLESGGAEPRDMQRKTPVHCGAQALILCERDLWSA